MSTILFFYSSFLLPATTHNNNQFIHFLYNINSCPAEISFFFLKYNTFFRDTQQSPKQPNRLLLVKNCGGGGHLFVWWFGWTHDDDFTVLHTKILFSGIQDSNKIVFGCYYTEGNTTSSLFGVE
jgi:hypothetical protein